MSYAEIPRSDYEVLYPHSATHAGSLFWTKSPIPSWGENPMRAGPASLGDAAADAKAAAIAQATAQARQQNITWAIPVSAQQAITEEEKKVAADPNIARVEAERAEYGKTPVWAFLLLGGAGLVGVGVTVYMLRTRHG